MADELYLDYNATTPLKAAARAAVVAALDTLGNPSSVHGFGRSARRLVEDARERVAALAGVQAAQVVFTSGGSEANNFAIRGAGQARVLVSAIEHESVLAAAIGAEFVPVAGDGVVDLNALEALLDQPGPPALVSIMLANNETGVIQPVAEAARLAHARGALVHCDAVQGAGRLALDMGALGVDLMTVSAHKLGGPRGVGALLIADTVEPRPLIAGGGQERSRRAGTENVAGIAGFGAAARSVDADLADQPRLAELRDDLEARAASALPALNIFGASAPRLANTTCLAIPGLASDTQIMALDLEGIAVSAGSACSSGKVGPSHVLRAMGAGKAESASALRVSLGAATRAADIDRFLEVWTGLAERHATRAA